MSSPPAAGDPLPSWLRVGVPAGIFLLSFLAFYPALDGEFLNWDDQLVLTSHDAWKGLGWDQVRWAFTTHHSGHYHPLTWLTFGLDYTLWGDKNPRGFHLVNMLLHATSATLFFFVVVRLIRPFVPDEIIARLAAAAGTLFFAIHPLRVESVAWITERRDVLSGCFFVLTLLAWLKWVSGGGRKWYGVALIAFALSLLSKAWGITLPVILLLLDVHPLRRFTSGQRGRVLLEKVPFVVLAFAGGVAAYLAQHRVGAMDIVEGHTLFDRVVQAGYGAFFYLGKTIAPFAQNPLYALKPSFDPLHAPYLAGALGALVITAVVLLIRRRRPEPLAAWATYIVIVSPVLGLAQAGPQLVAERYSYLACLPFAVLGAAGLAAAMQRPRIRLARPIAFAAVLLTVLGVQAWSYSHDWRDSVSLWTRAVRLDPENTQAWFNLGSAKLALRPPDNDGAYAALTRTVELNPRYASAYLNRGLTRMPQDPKSAIADFDAALRVNPDYADALANRGVARLTARDYDGGLADLDRALKVEPNHHRALVNRGLARLQRRDFGPAQEDLSRAIRLNPRDPDAWYIRALAKEGQGDAKGAAEDCARALYLAPAGWAYAGMAEQLMARVKRRDP